MADDEERVYTIPLAKVWSVPRIQRAPRALRAVKEFVGQHMKARLEDVWVDPRLNEILWARGREKPPRRVQVKVIKLEDETVEVSPLIPEAAGEEEEEPKAKEEPEVAAEGAAKEREPEAPEGLAEPGEKKTKAEKPAAKAKAKPRGRGKGRGKAGGATPAKAKKRAKGAEGKKKR